MTPTPNSEGMIEFTAGLASLIIGPDGSAVLSTDAGALEFANLDELRELVALLAEPSVQLAIGVHPTSDNEPDPAGRDAMVVWLERQFESSDLL